MNNTLTRIQLIPTNPDFISGYLDVDQRVPVPLNFAISDIRDPQKRTGSFSKTITLPGTKNNNYLLGQLFDININQTTGLNYQNSFNVSRLYRCIILEDNVPLHDNEMNLQLISVNKQQDSLTEDDLISYEVLIRDDVGQFFSEINNLELSDLSFTELNHDINAFEIITSFISNTWVNGYKYVLPYKDNSRFYSFWEPILSIYAKTYWNKIHQDAGFTYEFYNNVEPPYFDKLIIPSNKSIEDQLQVTREQNKLIVNQTAVQNFVINPVLIGGTYRIGFGLGGPSISNNLVQINNIVQDILGTWTPPFSWTPALGTSNQYKVSVQFDYRFLINNPNPFNIQVFTDYTFGGGIFQADMRFDLNLAAGPGAPASGNLFDIDRSLIQQENNPLGQAYPPGNTQAYQNTARRYNNTQILPNTQVGQTWQSRYNVDFISSIYSPDNWNLILEISNLSLTIELDTDILILNQIIDVSQTVPDMKQSDFLKSIYTMYNLYVVPDKNIPNKLIYYTRDDFYRTGKELDWTYKMARDQEQKLEFLPELRNKELLLTYKEEDDEPNTFYKDFTRKIYGEKSIFFDVEWTKGVDKKELGFSPTPGGQSPYDHYLPYISREDNPRILIDGGCIGCSSLQSSILIVDSYGLGGIPVSFQITGVYTFISHLNKPVNPNFDINFGENPYYFYDVGIPTLNNLYNGFWKNTVELIDKGKMLTAYFWLDPVDIFQMDLNDRIRVDNSYWNINRIIDYDAGNKRLTKVELISQSELRPTFIPVIPAEEEIGDGDGDGDGRE